MNQAAVIEKLNHAISLELCAVIQYNQYTNLLTGPDRRLWRGFFKDMSEGALEHARKFGFRVKVLGGTPTIEPAPVKQASDITAMLNNALELETALAQAYTDALEHASDHPAYRNLLEDIIQHEHEEVEEILLYLNRVEKVQAAAPAKRSSKAG